MRTLRRMPKPLLPLVAALVLVCIVAGGPAAGDDRDLLRRSGATPYVFFMIDSSLSMNADIFHNHVPANGDDPRSKMYMVKKAVYEVFRDATDFNYGFAGYNQDRLQVRAKHWLYRPLTAPTWSSTLPFPSLSDEWVFGPHFVVDGATMGELGSCNEPVTFASSADRQRLNRLAKTGSGLSVTTMWFISADIRYRMQASLPADVLLGHDPMPVKLSLDRINGACGSPTFTNLGSETIEFRRITDFLYMESGVGSHDEQAGGLRPNESFPGPWPWIDGVAEFDCGSGQPFTGKGFENNYDNEGYVDAETGLPIFGFPDKNRMEGSDPDVDEHCHNGVCYNAQVAPTRVRDEGRNVDGGDFIPYDWQTSNLEEFLRRLNPNHGSGLLPDFRTAGYFRDQPLPGENFLRLRDESKRPLVAAAGGSPFAKAINDFRCWYAESRTGQCQNTRYPEAWETVARREIGNEAGCVNPYQILITDTENTCGGEAAASNTAALNAQANVKTWVIAVAPDGSGSGQIEAISRNGRGKLIYVENEQALRDELKKIRGEIEEERRTFASAAVPTVQATVSDKIYVSNFDPLEGEAVWSGHLHSFLKPLPLTGDIPPRPDVESDRHLWDAGAALLTQANGLGPGSDKRRVYYTPAWRPDEGDASLLVSRPRGEWPEARRMLAPTSKVGTAATAVEKDLWLGLGIEFVDGDEAKEDEARLEANGVLAATYAVKQADSAELGTFDYLLGDVFHSDPVVVGAPASSRYFALDLHGYREFALHHENRRRFILVGTNDGMLHAFDAGVAELASADAGGSVEDIRFTEGTGKEIFAYVPREMLPELRDRTTASEHDWGVDGSPRVADVFIDPVFDDAGPVPADREWRTVVVGGFREGGRGYYALDITKPDPISQVEVGVPERTVFKPASESIVPACHDEVGSGALGCHDELKFPAALWEFRDEAFDEDLGGFVSFDEDANGFPDLAHSWSIPNIGRIRICGGTECLPSLDPDDPDDIEERYVAVFGGGLPGDPNLWGSSGNWIYIVDIETGEAIYKRKVDGSLAAEPAAVDTDFDGFLDRIYFGTVGPPTPGVGVPPGGLVYRIDLVEFEIDEEGNRVQRPFPGLLAETVGDVDGGPHTVLRVPEEDVDGDPVWQPRPIFDTVGPRNEIDPQLVRRPVFQRVSVFFVAELARYALSFGTGNRENLWRETAVTGRFYTFVDDSDRIDPSDLPMTETDLRQVLLSDPNVDTTDPLVPSNLFLQRVDGSRGWFLVLHRDDRLIGDPFNLSGVTFFVAYQPRPGTEAGVCTREGDSHIFAVNTTNANGFLRDFDGASSRFIARKAFATNPFTEQAQTKNPAATGAHADSLALEPHLAEIMEELKTLFPANCRFGSYRIDIKTIMSDTGVVFVAPVPVCMIEKNWKEFDY